jgi:hypothetical protein
MLRRSIFSKPIFITSVVSTSRRHQSSILGTSTLSPEFLEQFREDVMEQELLAQEERKIGGIMASCIRKSELDHMESPESEKRHLAKLDKQVDTLFSRLPEPKDPMKAALAPTRDELEENEKFEALKEAMREKYHSQLRKKNQEASRIDAAMKAVEEGTYEAKYSKSRPKPVLTEGEEAGTITPEQMEKISLLQELEETKRKMRELEKMLEATKKQQQ